MEDLTRDELLTITEDAFDNLIAPEHMARVDNNKVHLLFKANMEGFKWLNKSGLALRHRFDPINCDEADLKTTGRIVGTDYRPGKPSTLLFTIVNTSEVDQATLVAGDYEFESSSGEVFTFIVPANDVFDPLEQKQYYAASANVGAYYVTAIASAEVTRSDGASIPGVFTFACADNISLQGYPEETDEEFRRRIAFKANRDDAITKIEEEILALSGVLECNCVFNSLNEPVAYDGITLAPKELLITISGAPVVDIAKIVASHGHYKTHMVDAGLVIYYSNPRYINGQYPVYYRLHSTVDFTLEVEYNFNSKLAKYTQVEGEINTLLAPYFMNNRHIDVITEKDIYNALEGITTPDVRVLNVTLLVGAVEVAYVNVPRTRVPRLIAPVGFTRHDIYGV